MEKSSDEQPTTSSIENLHFIVLSHGNNGHHDDMEFLENVIRNEYNEKFNSSSSIKLFTLRTKSNSKDTHHGVAEGGKRMANEIIEYFRKEILPLLGGNQKVKFSLIGHSLGGLYCRYAAYELMNEYQEDFSNYFEPIGLTTICSPHLGSKRTSSGGWFDLFGNVVSGIANTYVSYFLGETGKQLALSDPLLMEMSEPDSKYISAWNSFKFKTLFGCTQNDISVPHSGACISARSIMQAPSKNSPIQFSIVGHSGFETNYSHLFPSGTEMNFQTEDLDETIEFVPDSNNELLINTKMLNNLQKHVNCRRIHIQFSYPSFYHSVNGYVHDLVINKVKMHYWINQNEKAAVDCVNTIASVVLTDHFQLP